MINYSLGVRLARPGKPEQGNKTFPTAQYNKLLSTSDLAEHMSSHSSKYNKGDIMAILCQSATCIREQLLLGNKVELGDLGAFSVTLTSEGAENADAFTSANISDVKVRWSPSPMFKNLINEATFQYVASRAAQAEARANEKAAVNEQANPGDGSGTGGGGNLGE